MDELYRKDPPITIDQLAESEVPFDLGVEAIFYYQVHERPSKWVPMVIAMRKWFDIIRMLRSEGLQHSGYDYPDWRQFVNLDFTLPTRELSRTRLRWYDDVDYAPIYDLVNHNCTLLDQKDVLANLAHIRVGLESTTLSLDHFDLYVVSLLHCKYSLVTNDSAEHDALLPIYNNIYSLLLVKFNLHPEIFSNNVFWAIHSTLFLFPYEVGLLDIHSFEDKTSWLVHSSGLILNNIGEKA